MEALRIKPSQIKDWLESVQDEEDLANGTMDKIRNVMRLVYKSAYANDLIPVDVVNPLGHVHINTTSEYEALLVTPQEAWTISCRMRLFERVLTVLVAVTGLRIGEVLALRWCNVDWLKGLIHVRSNFVRGVFGEPKSPASKKPVVLHALVMGLLKTWRETTAYAGDQDFVFASERMRGKQPRVPNMLVADHLRPAAEQVIEIPTGHRFGFHNLRHALSSFLLEIGTDHPGHAAMGRPNDADEDVCPQSHGQEKGSTGQDGRRDGLKRDHSTTDSVAVYSPKPAWILVQNGVVGDQSWVILPFSDHQAFQPKALNPAWILDGMMVARDGVEPPTPAFSDLVQPKPTTTYRFAGDCQVPANTCKSR